MRNTDLFDKYIFNRQNNDDRKLFEERLTSDAAFAKEFNDHKAFVKLLQEYSKQQELRKQLDTVYSEEFGKPNMVSIKQNSFYERYGKTIGMAASVAFIAVSITLALLASGGYLIQKHNTSITNLSKEVQELKTMQEGIIDGIMSVKPSNKRALNANVEGTGFALNNNGYFVTSLHVVKGADSVFVLDNQQNTYSAHVVVTDNRLDLAILKIEKTDAAKFPALPYSFKKSNVDLGEKLFTLGFPSDEIVYSEGSLSSLNGGGDTAMYQISVPVNPGNSGGPLFDEQGNVVGIIKSKNRAADATGFAVKSSYLLDLIKNSSTETLQKELTVNNRKNLKNLKRSEQIKRITPCVYNIKVFKGN
ncbi:MAG: S1C family serine protease [Bacteroidia bacterium]